MGDEFLNIPSEGSGRGKGGERKSGLKEIATECTALLVAAV